MLMTDQNQTREEKSLGAGATFHDLSLTQGSATAMSNTMSTADATPKMAHAQSHQKPAPNQQSRDLKLQKQKSTASSSMTTSSLNKLGESLRNLKKQKSLLERRQLKIQSTETATADSTPVATDAIKSATLPKKSQFSRPRLSLNLSRRGAADSKHSSINTPSLVNNPTVQLQSGQFDIVLGSPKPQDTSSTAASTPNDSVKEVELRINFFLEQEHVHNVMLQDYLKALGSYSEIVKYQERANSTGGNFIRATPSSGYHQAALHQSSEERTYPTSQETFTTKLAGSLASNNKAEATPQKPELSELGMESCQEPPTLEEQPSGDKVACFSRLSSIHETNDVTSNAMTANQDLRDYQESPVKMGIRDLNLINQESLRLSSGIKKSSCVNVAEPTSALLARNRQPAKKMRSSQAMLQLDSQSLMGSTDQQEPTQQALQFSHSRSSVSSLASQTISNHSSSGYSNQEETKQASKP